MAHPTTRARDIDYWGNFDMLSNTILKAEVLLPEAIASGTPDLQPGGGLHVLSSQISLTTRS